VLFFEFLQVGRQAHVDPPNFGEWSINLTIIFRVCHAAEQQSDTICRTPPKDCGIINRSDKNRGLRARLQRSLVGNLRRQTHGTGRRAVELARAA
jgi:hypothetical protein